MNGRRRSAGPVLLGEEALSSRARVLWQAIAGMKAAVPSVWGADCQSTEPRSQSIKCQSGSMITGGHRGRALLLFARKGQGRGAHQPRELELRQAATELVLAEHVIAKRTALTPTAQLPTQLACPRVFAEDRGLLDATYEAEAATAPRSSSGKRSGWTVGRCAGRQRSRRTPEQSGPMPRGARREGCALAAPETLRRWHRGGEGPKIPRPWLKTARRVQITRS